MWGSGSACWFGPQFWMIHDIILVTLNYRWVGVRVVVSSTTLFTLHRRLGPLGFLSLGTSEVPGNAGMLDQVAALSWVQVGHCCCLSSAQLCLELQRRFAKISQSRRRLLLKPPPGY